MSLDNIIREFKLSETIDQKLEKADAFLQMIQNRRVVIYGAGAAGTTLLTAMRMREMEPAFFVDRRYQECDSVNQVRVCPPEALAAVNEKDTVVVMAINAEVIRKFNQEPFNNIRKYSPNAEVVHTGIDMNNILRFARCHKKLEDGEYFNLVDCLDCGAETNFCEIYQKYLRAIALERKTPPHRCSKKFDWFGYIMGQYCTLKCRDCCEHVPYLKNPVFSKKEDILSDCSKIAASCEFLRYIELIGGEPFMHPDFKEVLEGLLKIENVGFIKIFTNGTIVPKADVLALLKNPRVVITLSNYTKQATGRMLDNIYSTINALKGQGIRYVFSESREWTDWGAFHDRGRTDQQLAYNFSRCFIANCHRVFQGILYRCPHDYAGVQRGEMQLVKGEYVDLNAWDPEELAQKLDEFEDLKFTDGCRRCDMPFDCEVVPAAIQLK